MRPLQQSAHIVANRVRMKRQEHPDKVFLLVEGDDDRKLYGRYLDKQTCRIQVAYGRHNVEEALAILEKAAFPAILAIVDADFDRLDGRSSASNNLLQTDTHDAETMMLDSPALDHLLGELGDQKRVAEVVQKHNASICDILLTMAREIGFLRWYAKRANLSLRFEGLDFAKIINKKTWCLDPAALLDELQDRSQIGRLDRAGIAQSIAALAQRQPDVWQVCCGHDMVAILAVGLQRCLGACKPADIKRERLEKSLRLAYERAYFEKTRLWAAICAWESRHNRVLAK